MSDSNTTVASEHVVASSVQDPKMALSHGFYECILQYFNDRSDTQGLTEMDGQLDKLARLLFAKRQVPVNADHLRDTQLTARMISARRAYAVCKNIDTPIVTERMLQESTEGLNYWLNCTNASPIVDAPELVVTVMSPQESTKRIYAVLQERETWLHEQGLDASTDMSWKHRVLFSQWVRDRFFATPEERSLDEANRDEGMTDHEIETARRSRWYYEQERRAGSSQVWELLSFTGRVSEEDLRVALQDVEECSSASERAGNDSSAHFFGDALLH